MPGSVGAGPAGVARTFPGSVAEGVLRASDRPVLVVPWSGREHEAGTG